MPPTLDEEFDTELFSTELDITRTPIPSSEGLNLDLSKFGELKSEHRHLNNLSSYTQADSNISHVSGKRQKYSSMSAEVCPIRDKAMFQRQKAKKYDVRYMKELKNVKQKIKSSCLLSCDQDKCPMIKERLDQHKRLHHPKYRKTDNGCGTHRDSCDRAVMVSPTLSRMRIPKFALPYNIDAGYSIQTDITMQDFSPTNIQNQINKIFSDHKNLSNEMLKKDETKEVLPIKTLYKDSLQNEILNWVMNVPVLFPLNDTTEDIQNEIVQDLVNKINALATEVNDKCYEKKTKTEIDKCLNKLPLWLQGPKRDQILFKKHLKEKLWDKILILNKSLLGTNYEKHEDLDDKLPKSFEKEIVEWSQNLQLNPKGNISQRQVIDSIMKKLNPLLKIPLHTPSYKLKMKGEIIEILDDLSLTPTNLRYRAVQLNKLAEELANKLIYLQIKQVADSPKKTEAESSVFQQVASQVIGLPIQNPLNHRKKDVLKRIDECLDKLPVCNRNDLKAEICSTFMNSKSALRTNQKATADEIYQFLRDTGKISADKARTAANNIVRQVNEELKGVKKPSASFQSVIPHLSRSVSVYMWGPGCPAATSTPKKIKPSKVPKLNPEETTYLEKVSGLVQIWLRTLPKSFNEDAGFQKSIACELAGDIMDHQKLQQLAPDPASDKEKYQKYLIMKWLMKFEIFEKDTFQSDAVPAVVDLQRRLKDIKVPNISAPQHGTRQEMEYIKHMERDGGWDEDYVPKGIDVLEDQISVWLNEQPSEIVANQNRAKRNKMVHDLALNLQDHLREKNTESAIEADIKDWLKKIVNPQEKEHIDLLTQDLKDKVINLPQDRTLGVRHEERNRFMLAKDAAKQKLKEGKLPTQYEEDVSNFGNIQGDPDKTIREFIGKYIEHYYDIDDPMATGAFAHLLKTELRKLSPPTRKQVYEKFEQLEPHQRFNPESLNMELEYIKVISDWLNNIPVDPLYNTVRNQNRIEFINDLARNVLEIEEQRLEEPNAMDYDYLLSSNILTTMHTHDLPIQEKHLKQTPVMANQLLDRLIKLRSPDLYATRGSVASSGSLSSSLNMSDVKEQNLSDFINDYIRINGREIAHDELKLAAWTARLMKEVKKMIHEGADPATLTKAKVYGKFAEISIPTKESVEDFGLKIQFVKEISDWMKNLPLLPITDDPVYKKERIRMISELAETMCDAQTLKQTQPNACCADKELEQYIANWINNLPLDKREEIQLPIVIKQLMSRINKGSKSSPKVSLEKKRQSSVDKSNNISTASSKKSPKRKQSEDKGRKKPNLRNEESSKKLDGKTKAKTPADIIVETIESWSNKLPINLDDKNTAKTMKESIARQLYQKVGELNVDPKIYNDELLYREILDDEIETQLENVPQNSELQDRREEIKEELIDKIIETNNIIKENAAGDNYRHKLETTIDASIPNPVQSTQAFDPGFEIYKNHLADMFILENFDHSNDDVKAKYEKTVKREIDKYFECARNKNALPLTKDQIYNEIYSALFKVPMPNENSVIDKVEQVKTRCEIDAWYEELPIQETDNINELLERDQILSTLAKRIHEIEKDGGKVDEEINKETRKWLEKLPLKPGRGGIDEHVKQLQNLLKSTAAARKYVAPENESKGKGRKVTETKNKKGSKSPNTSQVPGPSRVLQSKATTAKPCVRVSPMSDKKPGDIIVEIVEEWCNALPLISTEENNKAIRDNISTRIIIQISELNMDADIFNDDIVYDALLDEELENVLSNLPVCCDFARSVPARKHQLKEMIKSIKPLIDDERSRYQYKQELNTTVASILKGPHETTAQKLAEFNQLTEEIVEDFVQYYYYINDEEVKQFYKNLLHDCVVKFFVEIRDTETGEKVDPLVKRNQLLCELQKIPVPQSALQKEVDEIKMKKEVQQFMNELSVPEGDAKTTTTKYLAKRLCDIEKSGYSPATEKKMNSDIVRCLTKLNQSVNPEKVDGFVKTLKFNESERKAPPMTSSQASNLNQDGTCCSPKAFRTHETEGSAYQAQPEIKIRRASQTPQSFNYPEQNLIAAAPASDYYTPVSMHPTAPQVWAWTPNEPHPHQSLTNSPVEYGNLRGGNFLSSSAPPQSTPLHAPQVRTPQSHSSLAGRPPMTDSPVQYENLRVGNFLSSSAPPQSTPLHSPQVPQLHSSLGRQPVTPNVSPGMAQPIRRLSNQPLSASFPRARMRPCTGEATSGPLNRTLQMDYAPQDGRSLTPAPVSTSQSDITSDSLFRTPVFKPVPFPLKELPFPIDNLSQLPDFAGQDARRMPGQENALPYMAMPSADPNEVCICKKCSRRTRRGMPYCLMAMDDFEDYLPPMWFRMMHHPGCFY